MSLKITVFASQGAEYQIPIYEVEVETADGVWTEVYGGLPELMAFLQGTKAAGLRHENGYFLPFYFNETHIRGRLRDAPFVLWPEENKG